MMRRVLNGIEARVEKTLATEEAGGQPGGPGG